MYITSYLPFVYVMPSITKLQQTNMQLGVLPAVNLSFTRICVLVLVFFYWRIIHTQGDTKKRNFWKTRQKLKKSKKKKII